MWITVWLYVAATLWNTGRIRDSSSTCCFSACGHSLSLVRRKIISNKDDFFNYTYLQRFLGKQVPVTWSLWSLLVCICICVYCSLSFIVTCAWQITKASFLDMNKNAGNLAEQSIPVCICLCSYLLHSDDQKKFLANRTGQEDISGTGWSSQLQSAVWSLGLDFKG